MGVLQRFERRLEGLVEGAFARVFKGAVEPVEIATALQREAADHKAILGQGRVLVPNRYLVELSPADNERLAAYTEPLAQELATMVAEHIGEQGWTTFGSVKVRLEESDDLDTGVFRVSSTVDAVQTGALPATQTGACLVNEANNRVLPLREGTTLIGRGDDAQIRLADVGISRRHARVAYDGTSAVITDLGSTNGTLVNDEPVDEQLLRAGDRIRLGGTTLVFRTET